MEIWLTVFVIFAVVWYWQDSLRSRELTLKHCRRLCEQHEVQFLDQSVHVVKLRIAKTANEKLCIRRFYAFEFSTGGLDRHYGVAVIASGQIEYLSLLHPNGEIIEGKIST